MRLLEVSMIQCNYVRNVRPREYLGTGIRRCPRRIEHILVGDNNRIMTIPVDCENCVLAKLLKTTHVVGMPIIHGEEIRFIVKDNREVRKLLKSHKDQVLRVSEVNPRELFLTERQKQVIQLYATGKATNLSQLSRELNISKPAALKLVRKAIYKLARRRLKLE